MGSKRKKHVINNQDLMSLKAKVVKRKLSRKDVIKIKESSNSIIKREFFRTTIITNEYFSRHSKNTIIKDITKVENLNVLNVDPVGFMKEMEWYILELLFYKKQLNEYSSLKLEFEDSFFRKGRDFGESILVQIKEKFGFSLWGIENELLIQKNQNNHTKKELQKYCDNKFQNKSSYLNFNSYLLSLVVNKIVDESDPVLYSKTSKKQIENVHHTLKPILSFFASFENFPTDNEEMVGMLLSTSTLLSVIDRFNILVKLLLNFPENIKNRIRKNFIDLLSQFDDYRIKHFLFEGSEFIENMKDSDIQFVESEIKLYCGDYKQNQESINRVLKEFYISKSSLDMLTYYTSLQISEGDYDEGILNSAYIFDLVDIIDCYRSVKSFSQTSFEKYVSKLFYYTRKYSNFDLLNQFSMYLNQFLSGSQNDIRIELYDRYISLSYLKYVDNISETEEFLSKTSALSNIDFDSIINQKFDNLKFAAEFEVVLSLLRHSEISITDFEILIEVIERHKLPIWYLEEVKYFLYKYYLKNRDLENIILEFSDTYFRTKNAIFMYPLDEMRNIFDEENRNLDLSKIEVSIFAKLCGSERLKYVFEDYLENNLIDYPSSIKITTGNKDRVRFVLEYICTRDFLSDMALLFEAEEQVVNERLSILSKLNEENEEDFDNKYTKEISELSQEVLLKKLVRSVNQSKLTVDSEKIYVKNKKDFDKFFDDFFDSADSSEVEYIPISDQSINLNNGDQFFFINVKEYTPKMRALEGLFERIVNKFLFDDDGLDSYLSTRIRHGTLQGQIRKPFNNNYLITEKISDSSEVYAQNEYIRDIVGAEYEKISDILNEFSKSIDNEISYIKQELLQIKYKSRGIDSGIFNLSDSFYDLEQEVYNKVKVLSNQKQIYDKIVEYIWKKIDDKVSKLQSLIKNDITNNFIDKLTRLEASLLANNVEAPIIRNNIATCKTEIQNALEEVAGWFERSQISEDTIVRSEDLISVSENIISKINSDFEKVTFNLDLSEDYSISSKELPFYIDILLILFNNSMKHSGIRSDALTINASITDENEGSVIKFRNNYLSNTEASIRKSVEKLEKELQVIDSSLDIPMLTKEGGSGYSKLYKIIKFNLQKKPTFNFKLTSEEFEVGIRMGEYSENTNNRG
ncbi:TPA: hypothetical protein ACGOZ2_001236 [Streptococcus suis]